MRLNEMEKAKGSLISKATIRQVLSSSLILMTSFIYGCKVGYLQGADKYFLSNNVQTPFPATSEEISWLASISYSGTIISVLICYNLSGRASRRIFIFCATLTFTVCWFLIMVTSSITVVIGCFFIYGVAASLLVITGHIYFSEIASPSNRELLGNGYFVATSIGTELSYLISIFGQYRLLPTLTLLLCICTLFLLLFMRESPYYTMAQGLECEAEKQYKWLRDKHSSENIRIELNEISKFINEQEQKGLTDIKAVLLPENIKLIPVLTILNCISSFGAPTIILSYGSVLIEDLTFAVNDHMFMSIFNIICLVSRVLGVWTTRIMNRRPQIMIGFLICGFIQLTIAILYFGLLRTNLKDSPIVAFAIASLFIILLLISGITSGAGMTIMKTEILPHRLKEFYTSVFAFSSDTMAFVTAKTFFSMRQIFHIDFLMILYAIPFFIGFILYYMFIPDTKDKSLYQIRKEVHCTTTDNTEE